ncbi:tetraspanin-31-B-like [Amphiura filiformis]|uniref:tetraspanin-31-B-like n=1 Tax=Amphiura filiformis TaxID=82378 RepID=UPI003B20E293
MAEGIDRIQKALIGINCFYVLIGVVLLCSSALAMHAVKLVITPVVGGLVFCGALLVIVAVLGIAAAALSHQGLLFIYLTLLTVTFVVQYCVSIACLVVMGEARRHVMLTQGWENASNGTRKELQQEFDCCGLDKQHVDYSLCEKQMDTLHCCIGGCETCRNCYDSLDTRLTQAARYTGGAGLLFGFLELAGIILGWCYRKQPAWAFAHTVLN